LTFHKSVKTVSVEQIINVAGITGYSHAYKWDLTPTSHHIQKSTQLYLGVESQMDRGLRPAQAKKKVCEIPISTNEWLGVVAHYCHPSYTGKHNRRIIVQAGSDIKWNPVSKITQIKAGRVAQLVECLPSKHETLLTETKTIKLLKVNVLSLRFGHELLHDQKKKKSTKKGEKNRLTGSVENF
jgi:hypothetical protein